MLFRNFSATLPDLWPGCRDRSPRRTLWPAVLPLTAVLSWACGDPQATATSAVALQRACATLEESPAVNTTAFLALPDSNGPEHNLIFAGQRARAICTNADWTASRDADSTARFIDHYVGVVGALHGREGKLAMRLTPMASYQALVAGVCSDSALNVRAKASIKGAPVALEGGYALVAANLAQRSVYFWAELEGGDAVIPPQGSDFHLTVIAFGDGHVFRNASFVRRDDIMADKLGGHCQREVRLDSVK